MPSEMNAFLEWLKLTHTTGENPLPALTRAGIAHLWFESIHPYKDGNGRVARAIIEKVLAQGVIFACLPVSFFLTSLDSVICYLLQNYSRFTLHFIRVSPDQYTTWKYGQIIEFLLDHYDRTR